MTNTEESYEKIDDGKTQTLEENKATDAEKYPQPNYFSSYDNFTSLNTKTDLNEDTFKVVDVKGTSLEGQNESKIETSGHIDQRILQRNTNVLRSRSRRASPDRSILSSPDRSRHGSPSKDSPDRNSPHLASSSSIGSQNKMYTKDYFISKKINNAQENVLYDDSFGSPEDKKNRKKPSQGLNKKSQLTYSVENLADIAENDHIIRNLESQNEMLDTFMPPSRLEPVPTTLMETEMSVAYKTTPDMVSYNYEEAGSPPRCKKKRSKLYHSPSRKREFKEDTHIEYNYNTDNMASLRANDLHCGRGSSPLRTKLKKLPKSKSKSKLKTSKMSPYKYSPNSKSRSPSKSPRKSSVYNQMMQSTSKHSIFDPMSSQRSVGLSSMQQTASPDKFQRRCKVSKRTSPEKLNKQEILDQERRRVLTEYQNSIETVDEDILEDPRRNT